MFSWCCTIMQFLVGFFMLIKCPVFTYHYDYIFQSDNPALVVFMNVLLASSTTNPKNPSPPPAWGNTRPSKCDTPGALKTAVFDTPSDPKDSKGSWNTLLDLFFLAIQEDFFWFRRTGRDVLPELFLYDLQDLINDHLDPLRAQIEMTFPILGLV